MEVEEAQISKEIIDKELSELASQSQFNIPVSVIRQPESVVKDSKTFVKRRNLFLGFCSPLGVFLTSIVICVCSFIFISQRPLEPPVFTITGIQLKALSFPSFCPSPSDMSCCTNMSLINFTNVDEVLCNFRVFNDSASIHLEIQVDVVIQNVNYNAQVSWDSIVYEVLFIDFNNGNRSLLFGTQVFPGVNLTDIVYYTLQQGLSFDIMVESAVYLKYLCILTNNNNNNNPKEPIEYLMNVQGRVLFENVQFAGAFSMKLDWLSSAIQMIDLKSFGTCNSGNSFCQLTNETITTLCQIPMLI